jgi:hypothetical protein
MGKVDSIVKYYQYITQTNEVEVFPAKNEVQVKKGEVIAVSGNSGSSTAPHLHFEIRDTESEAALNPLVYGFDIADHKAPEIRKLKVFAVNADGYQIPGKSKEQMVYYRNGVYSTPRNAIIIPSSFCTPTGGIGFAFDVVDRLDGAANQCGLYGTSLKVDNSFVFGMKINLVSFEETRFINTHRDLNSSGKYHKSYRTRTNPLGIYTTKELGIIYVKPGDSKWIQLDAFDPKNNNSQLNFAMKVSDGEVSSDYNPDKKKFLFPSQAFEYVAKNWMISADSLTVYEPTPRTNYESTHFCSASVEIQNTVTIRIKLDNPGLPIDKYYIAAGSRDLKTTYNDGWLIAKSKYAGNYSVKTDVQAPVIQALSYTSLNNISTQVLKYKLSDSQTGIAEYNLYIDCEWTVMEYESKGNILFFERPKTLEKGIHLIKITAKDGAGNEVVHERELNFL